MDRIAQALGHTALRHVATLSEWFDHHAQLTAGTACTTEAAALCGLAADRLAYAFASGYSLAMHALVPALQNERVALLATEKNGAHPKAIETRLHQNEAGAWVVTGLKTWGTLADVATKFLVIAKNETGKLAAVIVDARASNITLRDGAHVPFVPEIHHSAVAFDGAEAETILQGDGYDQYLKPFRTIEDCHVFLGVLGYVLSVAERNAFPRESKEELLGLMASLLHIGERDPLDVTTHLMLSGTLRLARQRLQADAQHWQTVHEAERTRWERDQKLLTVAEQVRGLRTDAAWSRIQAMRQVNL